MNLFEACSVLRSAGEQTKNGLDPFGGLLGVELEAPPRQQFHIQTLTGTQPQMGQQFLAQRHLPLPGHREGCGHQNAKNTIPL